jgi:hypothetical protein
MDNKMKKTLLFLVSFLFIYNIAYSQNKDSLYTLTSYVGAGYVYNVTSFDYEYASLNRGGWQAYLRVMWKPEYLLSGGIEFGYTGVYSIDESSIQTDSGATSIKTNSYAYPLMIVFSMSPRKNWEVNVGTGVAFSVVKNEAFGSDAFSSNASSTSMVSTAYYYPVMKDSRLGLELRGTWLPKYDDYLVSLAVSFAYKFFEY